MPAAFRTDSRRALDAGRALGRGRSIGGAALAQDRRPIRDAPVNSASALRLPQNPQVFGQAMPSVVKATAIVNGDIITQTDIDQRLALLAIANGGQIPADEVDRLRQQVLRNLIDETLQIQAAKSRRNRDQAVGDRPRGRARRRQRQADPAAAGRPISQPTGRRSASMRRQIEGEIAWQRLQRAKIESSVSVGDDEVKAVLDRMNASKGTEEYRVGEIFLSANSGDRGADAATTPTRSSAQLRNGASFAGYARQYSEASTAAVGGDLGWVRPEQLPDPLAARSAR